MKKIILIFGFSILSMIACSQTYSKIYDLSKSYVLIDNGQSILRDMQINNYKIFIQIDHLCDPDTMDNIMVGCAGVYELDLSGEMLKKFLLDSIFGMGNNKMEVLDGTPIISSIEHNSFEDKYVQLINLDLGGENFKKNIYSQLNKNIYNNGLVSYGDHFYTYGYIFKSGEKSESHIQKINSNFELVDEFRFSKGLSFNDCLDLQPTVDGNLIYINDWSDGVGAQPNGAQIMVIDTEGNPLDSLNINDIDQYTDLSRVLLASSTGDVYCFSERNPAGQILQSHGRVNKYDKDLDTLLWSTELPFNNFTNARRYEALNMIEAQNGDILVCGTVFDEGPDGPIANGYDHTWNGFVTRLDTDGNILWLRLYKTDNNYALVPKSEYGRFLNSTIWNIHELEDGRIVTGGTSYHTGWQNDIIRPAGETEFYVWLMTVKADGCLDGEECDEVIILDGEYRPKDGYLPIITDKQTWISQSGGQSSPPEPFQYTYSEDSVSQTTNYYFERLQSNNEDGSNNYIQGYYRESEGKVYQKFEGNFNEEAILDMSLIEGDTFVISDPIIDNHLVVVNLDTIIYLDNIPRKRIELQCAEDSDFFGSLFWVEGIGELYSGTYCAIDGIDTQLRCVIDNDGQRIYSSIGLEENCWLTTSTEEIEFEKFSIYPNPVTNKLEIISEKRIEKAEIYTLNGIKVKTETSVKSIDLTNFNSGIYFLKVFTDHGVRIQSFFKY